MVWFYKTIIVHFIFLILSSINTKDILLSYPIFINKRCYVVSLLTKPTLAISKYLTCSISVITTPYVSTLPLNSLACLSRIPSRKLIQISHHPHIPIMYCTRENHLPGSCILYPEHRRLFSIWHCAGCFATDVTSPTLPEYCPFNKLS